jgi:hypothetical protein
VTDGARQPPRLRRVKAPTRGVCDVSLARLRRESAD